MFFHSKTCGSCAKLHADIEVNAADIPDDVVIMKTDWDENQDLAKKFNVDKYHTVAFIDGDSSTNVKGLFTLDEVVENFNEKSAVIPTPPQPTAAALPAEPIAVPT